MTRSATVRDYMARNLLIFAPETDIHRAMKMLIEKRFSGAPVVDAGGAVVGVLSKKDCLRVVFSASYHQDLGGSVAEYMSTEVETIEADMDIVEAAERFLAGPFRRFPVTENGRLVGQISRYDVLRALDDLW
jgi:CBS domain-containing protein